jgi:hypothetical protein
MTALSYFSRLAPVAKRVGRNSKILSGGGDSQLAYKFAHGRVSTSGNARGIKKSCVNPTKPMWGGQLACTELVASGGCEYGGSNGDHAAYDFLGKPHTSQPSSMRRWFLIWSLRHNSPFQLRWYRSPSISTFRRLSPVTTAKSSTYLSTGCCGIARIATCRDALDDTPPCDDGLLLPHLRNEYSAGIRPHPLA